MTDQKNSPSEDPKPCNHSDGEKASCAGGCGGPGLCPGIALFIAWGVGMSLTSLTGLQWLGWSVGIPLGLILITGAWKWLAKRR